MNINEEVQKATQEYLDSDKLKDHIRQQAEGMVNKLVEDTFGYFGGIKKQIEEAIKEEVRLDIKELGIGGLSTFITDVVKDKLHKNMREEASEKIGKEIEKILSPIDEVITIEKLKEELLSDSSTYNLDICGDVTLDMLDGELGYHEEDVFTFIIVEPSESNYEWVTLYIDKEPNKSKHECEYQLTAHKSFTGFKINEREMNAKDKVFNRGYGFEDFLYSMYLNNSRIDYEDAKNNVQEKY